MNRQELQDKALEALRKAKERMTYLEISNRLGVGSTTPARWMSKTGRHPISQVYARLILQKFPS